MIEKIRAFFMNEADKLLADKINELIDAHNESLEPEKPIQRGCRVHEWSQIEVVKRREELPGSDGGNYEDCYYSLQLCGICSNTRAVEFKALRGE